MSAESPMRHLWWRFWWATPRYFLYPGLYVWTGRTNQRVVAWPRKAA